MTDNEPRESDKKIEITKLFEQPLGPNERKFHSSERYNYSMLRDNEGNRYFSKRLIDSGNESDTWARALGREPAWSHVAQLVADANPQLGLAALMPIAIEEKEGRVERIIYPFIEAPFVAEPGDSSNLHDQATRRRYVEVLLAFDAFGKNWQPDITIDNSDEHTPIDQLDKPWNAWIKQGNLEREGVLDSYMINDARKLVADYAPYITPQIQHGDFVPWHLFNQVDEQGNSTWISFDGEHASLLKPRFYDIAYSYSRIFTTAHDENVARAILTDFVRLGCERQQFTENEFLTGFLPVLMTRSMGMFFDAHSDLAKSGKNYFPEARDLFERCISRDLTALIQQ